MIDDYRQILSDCRAPERVEPMVEMATLLFESGYEVSLGEISTLLSDADSSHDIVEQLESIILSCYSSLMQSFGINVNIEMSSKRPHLALELLKGLLNDIERFDDHDSLLTICINDDPDENKLANILSFIHGTDMYEYSEMYESVLPRTMEVIKLVLTGNHNAGEDQEMEVNDRQIADQMILFMRACPNEVARDVFDDGEYNKSREELIASANAEDGEDYLETLIWMTAGILLSEYKSYYDAYAEIDEVLPLLDTRDDEFNVLAGREVAKVLTSIYDEMPDDEYYEELDDEQD